MLTDNQKKAIEFITEQFENLNASQQRNTKFNLVDVQPVIEKKEKILQLDREEELMVQTWNNLIIDELNRISSLFEADLPSDKTDVIINKYEQHLKICKRIYRSNGHVYNPRGYDDCVTISLYKIIENVYDNYSQKYRKNISEISYRLNYTDARYKTIEELVATDEFINSLINRVL
jgi:hypothetical protein